MIRKAKATLLVEVETKFDDEYADLKDEESVRLLVKQDLEDSGFDVLKCELLDCKHEYNLMLEEQLKRVEEAELNFQMETAKLNELMKSAR